MRRGCQKRMLREDIKTVSKEEEEEEKEGRMDCRGIRTLG